MKKFLLGFAVLLAGTSVFTSCGKDDNGDDPNEVVKVPVDVSTGVFVVGSGNLSNAIDGNVSYIDYVSGTSQVDYFKTVNGRSIGLTANDALVYGSKVYFFVTNENTIEVCDRKTLRSIRQLKTTDLVGDGTGAQPRHGVASDGRIYVSFFGDASQDNGIVAAIDTTNFALVQKYTAGSYPEGLAIVGGNLFVANSNYGRGNASISKINIATGEETVIKHDDITNPNAMTAIDGTLYVLDYGTYDASWNQIGAGVRRVTTSGQVTKVADATVMGSDGKKIYTVNNPYGSTSVSYGVYDPATMKNTAVSYEGELFSPAAISADPVTGQIFVASLSKNPETGYANYSAPGYINQYDSDGKLVKTYDVGVGPVAIVFNTGVDYVQR